MPGHPREHVASSPRYEMLDVWRGVVSLVVVLEHVGVALWVGPGPGAQWASMFHRAVVTVLSWNVGTPLFFVMSGYCIAASLVSSQRRGITPLGFLGRRLWRIYPTYWVALLLFVLVVTGLDATGLTRMHRNSLSQELSSPLVLNRAQWLGNLTLTETWRPLVGGGEPTVFTRVAWSLCYQEQFYLVCVLALWLAPKRLGTAMAVFTGAVVFVRVVAWDVGALYRIEGLFPVYWHEFAVGLAVYWRLSGAGAATFASRRALELFVACVLVAGCQEHVCVSTIAAAGFGLVLIGMYRWDQLAGGLAWLAPVRACGRRSFSIYLTHLPVAAVGNQLLAELGLTGFWPRVLVMVPLVTLTAVALGFAFHHAVERWFLTPPQFSRPEAVARGPSLAAVPA